MWIVFITVSTFVWLIMASHPPQMQHFKLRFTVSILPWNERKKNRKSWHLCPMHNHISYRMRPWINWDRYVSECDVHERKKTIRYSINSIRWKRWNANVQSQIISKYSFLFGSYKKKVNRTFRWWFFFLFFFKYFSTSFNSSAVDSCAKPIFVCLRRRIRVIGVWGK